MNINNKAKEARNLLLSEYQGILSTHSVDVSGYPFGSVVPYCMNKAGEPIILISAIAQHTKNIISDPRVSLIATEREAADQQTVGRVTYIGNAEKLNDTDVDSMERYYNFFPQSRDYHKTHDFHFYILKPVRVRFIGGFGQIYWVGKEEFLKANPFDFDTEKQMLEHMNADHLEAIRHYCQLYTIFYEESQLPEMVGIDGEGFHLRTGDWIHRISFNDAVNNAGSARKALVEMARRQID